MKFNLSEVAAIVGLLGTFAGWLYYKIDEKFKMMMSAIDKQSQRTDQQSQRTDRLYEMFIDLIKERK